MHKCRKILFVLKKRCSYGISYGLHNSARLVAEALQKEGVACKVVEVEDNNCIDKEVHGYKPTHVFCEAIWIVPEKFNVLLKLYPKIKWYIRLHSQVPFLAHEGHAFEWINRYQEIGEKHKNLKIASNSKMFVRDVGAAMNIEISYVPNIYLFEKQTKIYGPEEGTIDIGMFGAIRPFKNHLNQALAAIIFADSKRSTLNFHINSSRFENQGEAVLSNLRAIFSIQKKHKLIEHPWCNQEDFIKLVRKMDLGLQASYTETFDLCGANLVVNNIPLVGSPAIEWLSAWYQADPNSVDDIVDKLDFAWQMKKFNLQRLNEIRLNVHNKKAIIAWIRASDNF